MRSRASGAARLDASFCCCCERALALSELRLLPISLSCLYICTFFGRAAPDRAGARPYQSQRHRLLKSANPRLLRRDVKLDQVDNFPPDGSEKSACILQSNAIVATSPYNSARRWNASGSFLSERSAIRLAGSMLHTLQHCIDALPRNNEDISLSKPWFGCKSHHSLGDIFGRLW